MVVSTSSAGRTGAPHDGANQSAIDLGDMKEVRHVTSSQSSCGFLHPTVQIAPVESIKRLGTGRPGWFVESIHAPIERRMEFRFQGQVHLLAMYNEGARRDGETSIDGVLPSTIRSFAKKLTFVPAGCGYREQLETAASTHLTFLYLDPAVLANGEEAGYAPRVHFEDAVVWETAAKLRSAIEARQARKTPYLSALSNVLAFELSRCDGSAVREPVLNRGGLASWQKRIVVSYIEQHMSEQICLASLAERARLSQHHFCRAFKQSFGVPPHRYLVQRRMEQAKLLLADRALSITDVGLTLGYSQPGSFSVIFRKLTGGTPTEYRREFE